MEEGIIVTAVRQEGNTALLYACKTMDPFKPEVFTILAKAGSSLVHVDKVRRGHLLRS